MSSAKGDPHPWPSRHDYWSELLVPVKENTDQSALHAACTVDSFRVTLLPLMQ